MVKNSLSPRLHGDERNFVELQKVVSWVCLRAHDLETRETVSRQQTSER
jgi:hypothetical protein